MTLKCFPDTIFLLKIRILIELKIDGMMSNHLSSSSHRLETFLFNNEKYVAMYYKKNFIIHVRS